MALYSRINLLMVEPQRRYTLADLKSLSSGPEPSSSSARQKRYEAGIIAQALGLILKYLSPEPDGYDVYIPDEKYDKAPDAIVSFREGRRTRHVGVEVVSFTPYSASEGVKKFLARTKLSPVYAYPSETVIICDIRLPLQDPGRASRRLSRALESASSPVYLYCSQPQGPYMARVTRGFEEITSP